MQALSGNTLKAIYVSGIVLTYFTLISCKKASSQDPVKTTPEGSWILSQKGHTDVYQTDGKWIWTNVNASEAYRVVFTNDSIVISYDTDPPTKGTYHYTDSSFKVILHPEDTMDVISDTKINMAKFSDGYVYFYYMAGDEGGKALKFTFLNENNNR
ncbi:hypothetical protein [Compostibacter hankyongensis]|uniref:Uncharacterized protein n=1 Tax=Compostibacter hankyongensis TaxID=1007089 RepID=A0ABP8G730_9BACT